MKNHKKSTLKKSANVAIKIKLRTMPRNTLQLLTKTILSNSSEDSIEIKDKTIPRFKFKNKHFVNNVKLP